MSNSIGKFGKALGALGIAAVGASLVKLGRDAVKAFKVQETAVRGLTTGMKLQGATIREINDALKTASTLQAKTVFGDEETIDAMKKAVATGADYTEVVKSASLAQDIASATGRDLGTIFELLGRGIQGDVTMLQRYVPSIKLLNKEQKTWANIQKILNAQFGGTAAKNAQTYTGQVQQMSNAWGDLQEIGGEALLRVTSPAVKVMVSLFTSLNEAIGGSATELERLQEDLEDLAGSMTPVAGEVLDLNEFFGGLSETIKDQAVIIGTDEEILAKLRSQLNEFAIAGIDATSTASALSNQLEKAGSSSSDLTEDLEDLAAVFKEMNLEPVSVHELFKSKPKDDNPMRALDQVEKGAKAFDIFREKQEEVDEGFKEISNTILEVGSVFEATLGNMLSGAITVVKRMEAVFSQQFFDVMMGNTQNLGKAMHRMFISMVADAMAAITRLYLVAMLKGLISGGPVGMFKAAGEIGMAQVLATAAEAAGGKAQGGAFEGGVEKFANGGIVSRPSLFRQNSGLGVMGEAGPEAIMPLARTHDGDLGVKSTNNTFILEVDGEAFYNAIKAREAFETRSGVLQTA